MDSFRKKLVYQSWHRGTREADLLFGPFADQNVEKMSSRDLESYKSLLELDDQRLLDFFLLDKVDLDLEQNSTSIQIKDHISCLK